VIRTEFKKHSKIIERSVDKHLKNIQKESEKIQKVLDNNTKEFELNSKNSKSI